jgi:ADP-ribose pyrophosphatase YjhB (NUDIX family)
MSEYPDTFDPAEITELRVATAAIIHDGEGRVMLQHRTDNRHWGLPGGALAKGESIETGLRREVREETGYDIEVERIIAVYSDPAKKMIVRYPDNLVHYVVVVCACRITGAGPAERMPDPAETLALEWFALDDLPEPMIPSHILRLQDYATGQTEAFLR